MRQSLLDATLGKLRSPSAKRKRLRTLLDEESITMTQYNSELSRIVG